MTMTGMMARATVLAALLVGTAAMPAAAVTGARADPQMQQRDEARGPDWTLLGVACVTFLIGRGAAQRRIKARNKSSL